MQTAPVLDVRYRRTDIYCTCRMTHKGINVGNRYDAHEAITVTSRCPDCNDIIFSVHCAHYPITETDCPYCFARIEIAPSTRFFTTSVH